jgi:hypothetical protein
MDSNGSLVFRQEPATGSCGEPLQFVMPYNGVLGSKIAYYNSEWTVLIIEMLKG